jgi:hypothetical protein
MGYRSDVHIAVTFNDIATLREVMAVYAMNPNVQKYNLTEYWEMKDDTTLYYSAEDVKWYENYEDVQGYEHMMSVAEMFHEERGIAFAYYFVRIGMDMDDMETREQHGGDDDDTLIEKLWDAMQIVRCVELNFGE